MSSPSAPILIAVDIGNSRIKLGRVEKKGPDPFFGAAFKMSVVDRTGRLDADRLAVWCDEHARGEVSWLIASVHRGAAEQFSAALAALAKGMSAAWTVRQITYRDVPMPIFVSQPARVGIDRLLAALAADRLRRPEHAAIVVDVGSAVTVDLVQADGGFAGGAILPGIAMSARALHEQTDALPHVGVDELDHSPEPLGKSTVAAIEAGLYWGTLGAVRELIARISTGLTDSPDVFLTGGASPQFAELLSARDLTDDGSPSCWSVSHVPNLVLAGIALVDRASNSS